MFLFLFKGVSSSTSCFGKAAFYCDTLWVFRLTILLVIVMYEYIGVSWGRELLSWHINYMLIYNKKKKLITCFSENRKMSFISFSPFSISGIFTAILPKTKPSHANLDQQE